jgi:hypothetical protein
MISAKELASANIIHLLHLKDPAMTTSLLLRAGEGSQEWVQLRQGLDTIVIPLPSR